MTDNTSATGGYLQPTSTPAIPDGEPLLNFFQGWIAGISGLVSTLVIAADQPEPPNIPPQTAVWCSFRFEDTGSDDYPAVVHSGSGDGQDTLYRNETFDVVCS